MWYSPVIEYFKKKIADMTDAINGEIIDGKIMDKLAVVNNSKIAIKNAIVEKGVEIPEGTVFRDYAEKIGEIDPTQKLVNVKIHGDMNELVIYVVRKNKEPYSKPIFTNSFETVQVDDGCSITYYVIASAFDQFEQPECYEYGPVKAYEGLEINPFA